MTKRHACVDCGAPVLRAGCRCEACRVAPRRARRAAYQERYHAQHRPSPQPRPQDDPDLPPYGVIVTDDERIQCHCCGRFYGSLVTHIRTHGLDAARYKERYELPRTASLLGPAAQERQRQAAIARGQGEIGRKAIAEIGPVARPKGLSNRLGSRIKRSEAGNPCG